MNIIFLTALGVGGATVFGALVGFMFKELTRKYSSVVLSFSAGIMLCAAIFGLIIPAYEHGIVKGLPACLIQLCIGIFLGTVCLDCAKLITPKLYRALSDKKHGETEQRAHRVILFVCAIAIHNLPEGLAAGVSFGTGSVDTALFISGAIALQNIPEGMVIISPMLLCGFSKKRTLLIAFSTGLIEVLGTLIGYFFIKIASAMLPVALAFAGGTMLYVICDDMIPESHAGKSERGVNYAFILGFTLMLILSYVL